MRTVSERFWTKVDMQELEPSTCWLWTGSRSSSVDARAYGQFWINGRQRGAHRVAFELATGGPVPDGCEIDHLCGVRLCVNPEHLEAVSHEENVRRGRRTRLTREVVLAIRSTPSISTARWAAFLEVAPQTIRAARLGRHVWTTIPGDDAPRRLEP